MIKYNRVKSAIIALAMGVVFAGIYIAAYLRGALGTPILGWEFFEGLFKYLFHPLQIAFFIIVYLTAYLRKRDQFHISYFNPRRAKIWTIAIHMVLSFVLVVCYLLEPQLTLLLAFVYFFVIGTLYGQRLGEQLFILK